MLPTGKQIIPPEGGWKPKTVYVVEVAWHSGNPLHRALFHTGFINDDGTFGGYCEVWCNSYERSHSVYNAIYLNVIQELGSL